MKKYQPISCNFYDFIEHFATLRTVVDIEFENESGEKQLIKSRIIDTQHLQEGEYLIPEKQFLPIRMDHIIRIQDKVLSDFKC